MSQKHLGETEVEKLPETDIYLVVMLKKGKTNQQVF